MDKLAKLRAQRGYIIDAMNDLAETGTAEQYDVKKAELREIEAKISRMQEAQTLSASLAAPVEVDPRASTIQVDIPGQMIEMNPRLSRFEQGALPDFSAYVRKLRAQSNFTPDSSKHFRHLGEQLQAVFNYYATRGASTDPRLVRAPLGASEVDPTGGGFLVQDDFQLALFMLAHDMGQLLNRVNKIPISPQANGLKIPGVDEESRATGSRWGGVQSYWLAEGFAAPPTKPKFRMVEFDLKKLFSVMYTTDELLEDSTALMNIAGIAFAEEVMFMTEDAIYEGSGTGQPLGYMNSPALVTVPKDNGQAAGTITKSNIDNMWSRLWARSRQNAVWLINQDAEPQLQSLNGPVGTGGELVYMPPGGISSAPYATLKGRPLIATEYNNSIGATGDITLVDLSQYTLVDKGGVKAATSMHVAFLTDQMAFRLTYRVDGKPMWHVPLAPFKGSATKSPFVALAAR